MKSLRLHLTVWYVGSFLATVALFATITYFHLRQELRLTTWKHPQADHPSWAITESFSQSEVNLLLSHLLQVASLLDSIYSCRDILRGGLGEKVDASDCVSQHAATVTGPKKSKKICTAGFRWLKQTANSGNSSFISILC